MKIGELLTRHRNTFLLALLTSTLAVGSLTHQDRADAVPTVSIPVTETAAARLSPLEEFRINRDRQAEADMAALERLCHAEQLDQATRKSAADRLQEIVSNRQAQSTLEGALAQSSLYPCAAVVEGGCVTIVTEKTVITEKDSALVLTLCNAHAGVKPENVRIITAE